MAKDKTHLEEFVTLYDEVAKAEQRLEALEHNPHDKNANEDAITYATNFCGRNILTQDEHGNMVLPQPSEVRTITETWRDNAQDTAIRFASKNLEELLEQVDSKKLPSVFLNTMPIPKYDSDAAKLHTEFRGITNVLHAYEQAAKENDSEGVKNAVQAMRKATPDLYRAKIQEMNEARKKAGSEEVLSEESIERCVNAMYYIGMLHSGFVVQAFEQGRAEKYNQIVNKLGESGIRKYIKASVDEIVEEFDDWENKETAEKKSKDMDPDKVDEFKAKRKQYEGMRNGFYRRGLYAIVRAK